MVLELTHRLGGPNRYVVDSSLVSTYVCVYIKLKCITCNSWPPSQILFSERLR